MKNNHKRIVLYFGVFTVAAIVRFILFNQTPYANGWDGYHYIMQIQSIIQEGHLHVKDSSLIFPYLRQFNWLFNDLLLSYKVGIAVLSGLFSVASVKLASNFTKDFWTLTFIGIWLIISPTLTFIASQFPKNLLGLFFFVLFLKYLFKCNYWLAVLFFIPLFLTHRMTAGLGVITGGIFLLFQMNKKTLFYVIPLATGATLAALFLPGIIHLSDLQRFSGSLFQSVYFPHYAFIQNIGPKNLHFFWIAEMIVLFLGFVYLGIQTFYSYYQKQPRKEFLFLLIPLLVLFFPFYSTVNDGIGYR